MPRLVIACARPGLIRGGVRHPKVAEHLASAFTPDQLRELLAEPEIAVVIGRPLTLHDVVGIEGGVTVRFLMEADELREAFEMGRAACAKLMGKAAETAVSVAGAAADTAAPATEKPAKGKRVRGGGGVA